MCPWQPVYARSCLQNDMASLYAHWYNIVHDYQRINLELAMIPEYIILHTAAHGTAHANGDSSSADIDSWHRSRGWRMIGYHYVVRLTGAVEQGRPEDMQGAHCTSMGMNGMSLGVCFSGHGDYHSWTPAQREAGMALVRELMARHGIPVANVLGHHETGAKKTCPGKLVDMDEVRRQLAGDAAAEVQVSSAATATGAAPAGATALVGTPASPAGTATLVDATAMFRHICGIFDDPEYPRLPAATRAKVMELRTSRPFAELTREDVV